MTIWFGICTLYELDLVLMLFWLWLQAIKYLKHNQEYMPLVETINNNIIESHFESSKVLEILSYHCLDVYHL